MDLRIAEWCRELYVNGVTDIYRWWWRTRWPQCWLVMGHVSKYPHSGIRGPTFLHIESYSTGAMNAGMPCSTSHRLSGRPMSVFRSLEMVCVMLLLQRTCWPNRLGVFVAFCITDSGRLDKRLPLRLPANCRWLPLGKGASECSNVT